MSPGRIADRGPVAELALGFARKHEERGIEARALSLLGEIVTSATSASRSLVAHCHLGLGKLYRRTGKQHEAHKHLTTATTMYREMDMRFWLEQAEAERKELA